MQILESLFVFAIQVLFSLIMLSKRLMQCITICFVILTLFCRPVQYSFEYDLKILLLFKILFIYSATVISGPFKPSCALCNLRTIEDRIYGEL